MPIWKYADGRVEDISWDEFEARLAEEAKKGPINFAVTDDSGKIVYQTGHQNIKVDE